MTQDILILNADDTVGIALVDIRSGAALSSFETLAQSDIPKGHKFALRSIAKGAAVIRYGQIIGYATEDIAAGAHVHSHNLSFGAHKRGYEFATQNTPLPAADESDSFMGYHRPDGQVGTRNYIGILTSVNCAGSVARFIAEAAEKSGLLEDFPNVDGIVPIVHSSGCGMSGLGEGYQMLFRTLAGYSKNPNFGAILLVGLGCEVMQVPDLIGPARLRDGESFRYMTIQQTGGTKRTIERGLSMLREIAAVANRATRAPALAAKLVVGMQCGGSDGYSGITANPAMGYASDLIVRQGGTTILSETPEIYGAEHLLTRRAISPEIGEKLISRIQWWEDYTARNGGEMDNNPSPGNKRGGLTTILEKSLGAVAKSGTAPLAGVYEFAEALTTQGFVYMDSPGYDPCSVTGQIASGANIITFTTGRGSVSGYMPTPCIKLSTNDDLYARMGDDMDINCGDIISGGISLADKGHEIYREILRVASGGTTKSEELGFGGVEFVPWQVGAVM